MSEGKSRIYFDDLATLFYRFVVRMRKKKKLRQNLCWWSGIANPEFPLFLSPQEPSNVACRIPALLLNRPQRQYARAFRVLQDYCVVRPLSTNYKMRSCLAAIRTVSPVRTLPQPDVNYETFGRGFTIATNTNTLIICAERGNVVLSVLK